MRNASLLFLFLFLGCLSNVKDCGENITCFQDAASDNCIPAKVRYSNLGLVEYLETRGLSEGKCQIYMRIDQVPSGLAKALPDAEGKDMICEIPMTVVHEGLPDMYTLDEFCEGTLIGIVSPLA